MSPTAMPRPRRYDLEMSTLSPAVEIVGSTVGCLLGWFGWWGIGEMGEREGRGGEGMEGEERTY